MKNENNQHDIVRRGIDFLWCIYEGNENTPIFEIKKMLKEIFFDCGKQAELFPEEKEELVIRIIKGYSNEVFAK